MSRTVRRIDNLILIGALALCWGTLIGLLPLNNLVAFIIAVICLSWLFRPGQAR